MCCIYTEALVFMFNGGSSYGFNLLVYTNHINNERHMHHGFLAYLCSISFTGKSLYTSQILVGEISLIYSALWEAFGSLGLFRTTPVGFLTMVYSVSVIHQHCTNSMWNWKWFNMIYSYHLAWIYQASHHVTCTWHFNCYKTRQVVI